MGRSSEPLGADQRVDEIDENDERYGRSQPVVENHGITSQTVAGAGVEHCTAQEGEPDDDKKGVKHENLILPLAGIQGRSPKMQRIRVRDGNRRVEIKKR